MNYIRVTSTTTEYPYGIWQLGTDYPNVMFPVNPADEDLAPFNVYPVRPTAPPEIDERTHRTEEATPVQLEDGTWVQRWEIREATPEETSAWDAAHVPAPQWMQFGIAIATMPSTSQLLGSLPQAVSSALTVGLAEASKGDTRLFLGLWQQIASQVDHELAAELKRQAERHHLPPEFIVGLLANASNKAGQESAER